MQGILLIDKPTDWTSFDVVNYIRKMLAKGEGKKPKQVKVGHAGTLDPFATGLLIVLVGQEYTRRASEFSKLDKTYEVTMHLGEVSTTGDPEGIITACTGLDPVQPVKEQIETAFEKFTGVIEQIPPAYSAVKVNGQRAYKLARAGKEVVIEPRNVTVNKLELIEYQYPDVTFTADVSSGTYIRSLVEDIGQELHTGAYTKELKRSQVGEYLLQRASSIKDLNIADSIRRL